MTVKLVVRHRDRATGVGEGYQYVLDQARIIIGRGAGADVRLPSLTVSEHHATIESARAHFTIRDESSTNGTLVGDVPLVPARPRTLEPGDEIVLGEFVMTFEVHAGLLAMPPERTASLARRLLREIDGASADEDPPRLVVIQGPEQGLALKLGSVPARVTLGSGEHSSLRLEHDGSAPATVEVERDADGVLARDLSERPVLQVNGKEVQERRLKHADLIAIGRSQLKFEDPAELTLRGMAGQPDRPLTRTRLNAARQEAAPSSPLPPAAPEPNAAPDVVALHAQTTGLGFEKVVYVLATLILAASIAGLVWLFS